MRLVFIIMGIIGAVIVAIAVFLPLRRPSNWGATINERRAAESLKQLVWVEQLFRKSTGGTACWTGDVRTLVVGKPGNASSGTNSPADPGIASADASPLPFVPIDLDGDKKDDWIVDADALNYSSGATFRGYRYRAMQTDDIGNPYCADKTRPVNPAKFGFCAYPAEYEKSGKNTYVVSELGTVFYKDTGGKPVETYPSNPKSDGWQEFDK